MPLIGKNRFVRQKPPEDLNPDEELFYCKLTHEVFREYEQFFERVILCNSLVWTCSITGRPGLTYQEAIDSERHARRSLGKFPVALKKPVVFLATLTQRGRLNDMCDDVFSYIKDRYFVGESVDVTYNGSRKSCEIAKVLVPDNEKFSKAENTNDTKQKRKRKPVNPAKVKYEISDKEQGKKLVVKAHCVSRQKGLYTRDKSKLFLKQHVAPKDGIWRVKDESVLKLGLKNLPFSDVFAGPPPYFEISPNKKKLANTTEKKEPIIEKKHSSETGKKNVQGKLNFKKETPEEKKKSLEDRIALSEKQKQVSEEQKQRQKDEVKKRIEEEKLKRKEQKLKEKEKKKEEKRLIAEYLSEWKKPRDDLECDDLKNLPLPTPVECSIPQELFGDAVMILEFLHTFGDVLQLKDSFSQGFTFDHLEKALTETDIEGPLNDLIQLLLTSNFQLQEGEDEVDEEDTDARCNVTAMEEDSDLTTAAALKLATVAAAWPQLYQGTILRKMPLDSFSVTEILRIHLLASGAERGRISVQGQSGIKDDPGLWFKIEEPQLLKKLAITSVFQLSCYERVKILKILIHQLLSCGALRNAVDDNVSKTRPLKMELKQLQWAFSRKEKEAASSNKNKKKQDDKAKDEDKDCNEGDNNVSLNSTLEGITTGSEQVEDEKENMENLSPEERKELEEKKAKEDVRRKGEFVRKEREILSQIQKLQFSFNITPLGRDRAYRRFWIFQSLSGLFVEDDDPFVGLCLPKETPSSPKPISTLTHDEVPLSYMRKYLKQITDNKNGSSDKENEVSFNPSIIQNDGSSPLKVRKLSDLNPRVDFKKHTDSAFNCSEDQLCVNCKDKMIISDYQDNYPKFCPHSKNPPVFGICTSCIETCPVHNINENRTRWAFYYKEEEIDSLLTNLNPRGFREGRLKEIILKEKERLNDTIVKCPFNRLNIKLPLAPQPEVRKSQRLQSCRQSDYAGIEPEEALEFTLRDMLLELEHRIFVGGLGTIKVTDREIWKAAIEQRSYDMQCNNLNWGSKSKSKENYLNEKEPNNAVSAEVNLSSWSISPPVIKQVVKDLACALLQVSQGIESKYLHPPLGEDDGFKYQKQKALNELSSWESRQKSKDSDAEGEQDVLCPKIPRSPLERWQESLMESSSLSQLYVHLGTLERSVAWSRSVLKAHCRICRRRGDAENMLLCDGCNRGHHLYCLKPPLMEIPKDDWYCLSCKPPEKTLTPRKHHQDTSDSESEEDLSSENEYNESDNDSEEEDTENDDVCDICEKGGSLICCDDCPLSFHIECLNLRRIPRGKWLCPKCSKKSYLSNKLPKNVSSGSYKTRAQTSQSSPESCQSSSSLRNKLKITGKRKRESMDTSESERRPPKKIRRDSRHLKSKELEATSVRRRSQNNESMEVEMLDYKACLDLLIELIHHPSSWPFLVPVSKKDVPQYHQIIKRPMDLGTIRTKLNNMCYRNNNEFVLDVFLVVQNCELFNPVSSPEYKAAQELNKAVEKLLKSYQLKKPYPKDLENQQLKQSMHQ